MAKLKIRTLLFLVVTTVLAACAAANDEREEGSGPPRETQTSEEPAADGAELEASEDWAGPTANHEANKASSCIPRIEASNWYCCGRFRECKAVYICEYCPNSKSCYRQGGIQERSSPGCY